VVPPHPDRLCPSCCGPVHHSTAPPERLRVSFSSPALNGGNASASGLEGGWGVVRAVEAPGLLELSVWVVDPGSGSNARR
jgi:hypothetical protein